MTGSKTVSLSDEMNAQRFRENGKMRKRTNLFEKISNFLIEAFKNNGE
ncbi:MAG: hypothetical protein ACP5UZ_02835 [Thermoplasmata archaeon]